MTEPPRPAAPGSGAVERLRVAVACLVLTAVVARQEGGRVVGDTKLDLTADPLGLLARALHLWDPEGGAGQLQNQAYGYLFPLGPVMLALQSAGVPDWFAQRLWQALVLCVALLGVRALAERLGIGTPSTRLLAGLAYALAARPVSQLGAISVEVWPYALAPWVLVPLVTGAQRGSPRRAAALSGLAVLLVGGVNAAATLAVVPLGVLWIALQPPGPRRRRLAAWWSVSLIGATAWWLGPLLVLGRYSPPFLDVIESAATTTRQTGLWSVLTGNDLWLQYLALGAPARPAGHLLVTEAALVVCSTAVAALGLVGVLHRRTPHRAFLVGGVLLGLLVVGAGHVGDLDGPFAAVERDLLDGALSPLRNVHKYDLLLRLPLALGLAAAAATVRRPLRHLGRGRVPRAATRPVAVLAALAIAGAATPALTSLQPTGSHQGVPGYWRDVAEWLADAEPGPAPARAMVVPAAPFGNNAWGRTGDEPLQVLARSPWVVRDAVPLGGPGVTRVLDAVEEALRSGRGSPALAAYLARAGVRHLVVRNDLDTTASGATRPLVVHAALAASPGLRRVAVFGPPVGAGFGTGSQVYDAGLSPTYPAVEVFEVLDGDGVVAVESWSRAGTQRVSGGPESVLPLLETGALAVRGAVRLAGEPELPGEQSELRTVTDGYRDREVDVGRASDGPSATLGGGSGRRLERPVADYLPLPVGPTRTTAVVTGVTAVLASSSASDADALLLRGRDHHSAAAFDGDGATTWATGGVVPVGQWVEARFPRTTLTAVELTAPLLAGAAAVPSRVRVTTDDGSTEVPLAGGTTRVGLGGSTTRLRLTITSVTGAGSSGLGVSALEGRLLTGDGDLLASRALRVPADAAVLTGGRPAAGPASFVLSAGRRDRAGCLLVGDRPTCSPALPLDDEDDEAVDRVLTVDEAALLGVALRGRARGGEALDALLQQGQPITARASSRAVADPAARPAAVLDRDFRTAWSAAPLDPDPIVVLELPTAQRITGVTVVVDPFLPASRPRSVSVRVDGGPVRTAALTPAGEGVVPAAVGRRVEIGFPDVERRTSIRPDGLVEELPVGVTELRLLGPPRDLRQSVPADRPLALPCGQGPAVAVDGALRVVTRVTTTVGDVLAGRDVTVLPCGGGPLELSAGEHRVQAARTATVQVTGLVLTDLARGAPTVAADRVDAVRSWGPVRRSLDVAAGPEAWLVVHEAFNEGWTARLGDERLRPVRLDGWQQGFLLPTGGGQVVLEFAPDRPYRLALLGGAALAVWLVLLAAVRPRRPAPDLRLDARRRRWPGLLLAAVAVPIVGGPAGVVAGLGAAALVRLGGWRLLTPLGVAGLVAAGSLVALEPWPGRALVAAPAQACALLAVAALAVSLWRPAPALPSPDPRPDQGQDPEPQADPSSDPDPGRAAASPAPPRPAAGPTTPPG
ncbi:MAG: alpha-(1-_3)-arabinofuranosyltransferase family protein [Mycobacteriales bacterium]|nr:alpha-(1->3)-arabinofuranosyltransferase family protein [Mycobacteriales bacterium]